MCDLLQPHDNSLYIQYLLRFDDAASPTATFDQIQIAIEKVANEAHCQYHCSTNDKIENS